MYKLIAIDIDGTLFNSEKKISNENKAAIAAAQAKGVRVVLASGRPTNGMMGALEELDMISDEHFVLSYNASVIQTVKTEKIIHSKVLTGKDAKQLALIAQQVGTFIHAFSHQKGLITPEHNEFTDHEAEINQQKITLLDFETLDDDEKILKVMLVAAPEQLTTAANKLPIELYEQFCILQSTPYFLEFLNSNSNKGIGVSALAKHLGLSAEEVICIGDAGNDFQMIQYAGLGVAMGNATVDIKAIADHVTLTNDQHGVAEVINEFVLSR